MSVWLALVAAQASAIAVPTDDKARLATSQDVVVEGRRLPSVLHETRAILRPINGQVARFETPVCPLALGFGTDETLAVQRRIREVSAQAGIRIAPARCAPNFVVIAAPDGRSLLDALGRKRPALFGSLSPREWRTLRTAAGPSWSWHATAPRRRDGGPVQRISQLQIDNGPPRQAARGAIIAENVQLSRLTAPVRQDIEQAFVVLADDWRKGWSIRQVADLATMLGLAALRVGAADRLGHASILRMLGNGPRADTVPSEATAYDLALLRSLYSGESGFTVDQKTAAMASGVVRQLRDDRP